MEDTSREIKKVHQDIWISLPVSERLRICAEMFETAKRFAESRLPAGLSAGEQKRAVFREIYGFEMPGGQADEEK